MLADIVPGSVHPREIGLLGASDEEIWRHAEKDGFVIVSKDDDFRQRALLQSPPPKVVWLVVRNAGTKAIAEFIREQLDAIEDFASNKETSVLILRNQR